MSEALALDVRDLSVSYGGIRAVKGVSFDVRPGEIVAMIGANGAGKSSTLKAIMRVAPSLGSVYAFGLDLARLETHQVAAAGVALVPEGRAIFGNLTVRENLDLGAYLKRDRARIAESLDAVVKLFPRLGERMRQNAGTLSGGEQQMLAIGRGMMAEPRLMLLDEPSLGLAPKLVGEIFVAIRSIAARGITILLVEQNTRLALETASRALVLVTGEVVLRGTAAELRGDPRVQGAYLGEAVKA